MSDRWTRLVPLTGVIAAVLAVVAWIVARDAPNADATADEAAVYYTDNDASHIAVAILLTYSAIFLVFFAGELRVALRRGEAHGRLSTVAFAGGVMTAIGLLISAGLNLTLADSTSSLDPVATQALHVMSENLFWPVEGGVVILLLASGIAIVRGAPLPGWLAVAAIVFGILGATTPFTRSGFLVGLIWIVIVSIVLAVGAEPEAANGEPERPSAGA